MTFITFVADHPIGSTMEGEVVSFTSHGAHIDVGGMLGHVPLRGLGDPAPARARSVLAKGETRTFELVSLDAPRRRAELTLPGIGDSATA
jgi:ribosomal protein S1